MQVLRSLLVAGMLAALAGCDAERILAIAQALDASSNPRDAAGDLRDAGGDLRDAGDAGDAGDTPADAPGNPRDAVDAPGNPSEAGSDAPGSPGDAGQPFQPPQVVTGLRGDAFDVQDPSMTFEELELYFVSATGGQNDIWVARRTVTSDPWGSGTLVAELSSPQNDEDPEVSVDGLMMFFSSDRGGDGMRLYAARRRTRDTPWEQPVRIDGLGTSAMDQAPALDRAQLYLVFASQRGAASDLHLFAATRPDSSAAWRNVAELTALSSASRDSDPALFLEGRALVFASRRTAPGLTADLFQTARPDVSSPFAARVEPIAQLNTSFSEEDPWISQDGRHILFVSDRDGRSRIYEARR